MSLPQISRKIAQFQLDDPNSEVSGAPMMGFIQCTMADSVLPALEHHHLDKIQPDGWYSFPEYLEVMRELSYTEDLVSVGISMMDHVPWPPETYQMSFPDVLRSINAVYGFQHRGDVGQGYLMEFQGERHVVITIANPYPDDLVYGCYWEIAKKFLPKGTKFKVYYDNAAPLRKEGGEETKIHIMW